MLNQLSFTLNSSGCVSDMWGCCSEPFNSVGWMAFNSECPEGEEGILQHVQAAVQAIQHLWRGKTSCGIYSKPYCESLQADPQDGGDVCDRVMVHPLLYPQQRRKPHPDIVLQCGNGRLSGMCHQVARQPEINDVSWFLPALPS